MDAAARAMAMRRYVGRRIDAGRTPGTASSINAYTIDAIRRLRDEIRADEGGGGFCHTLTEILSAQHGWGRLAVTYLGHDGAVVTPAHYVSVLGDHAIVDATADQFGEGHDVRVLAVTDPDYGRYRPEFDRDWNPVTQPGEVGDWAEAWTGEPDDVAQNRLTIERGMDWNVTSPADRRSYLATQIAFADAKGEANYAMWLKARLDALDARERHGVVGFGL